MVFLVEGRRQTLLYCYKWRREQHFVLRQIAKAAANKSIIARNRTLASKEPWNKNGSKFTNHKFQTVTFWTLWNEHLLPKRSAKLRWYTWAAFEKSWFSGRRYFYFSRLTPLVMANLTWLIHNTASYAGYPSLFWLPYLFFSFAKHVHCPHVDIFP